MNDDYGWSNRFDEETLDKGYQYYRQGKAKNPTESREGYSVTVRGSWKYMVFIETTYDSIYDVEILDGMSCTCGKGEPCKHEAAALYLLSESCEIYDPENDEDNIEDDDYGYDDDLPAYPDGLDSIIEQIFRKKNSEGSGKNKTASKSDTAEKKAVPAAKNKPKAAQVTIKGLDVEKGKAGVTNKANLIDFNEIQRKKRSEIASITDDFGKRASEKLDYFDYKNLRKDLGITAPLLREARSALNSFNYNDIEITAGYNDQSDKYITTISYRPRGQFTKTTITFDDKKLICSRCNDWNCAYSRGWSRDSYLGYIPCEHEVALILYAEDVLKGNDIGNFTTKGGQMLIDILSEKTDILEKVSDLKGKELRLEPTLICEHGQLVLTFKVGASRLYKVKNIPELLDHIYAGEIMKFGKSTELLMRRDLFDEASVKWLDLVSYIDDAEKERGHSLNKCYGGYSGDGYGIRFTESILLMGSYLDRFYDAGCGHFIKYEDGWDVRNLEFKEMELSADFEIRKKLDETSGEFIGISVTGKFPKLYYGANYTYCINDGSFCRVDLRECEKYKALSSLSNNGVIDVVIGRKNLSDFYYKTLPVLKQIAKVDEYDTEVIYEYLPPKPEFTTYLDLDSDKNILCRIDVSYGSKVHSLFEVIGETKIPEPYRDFELEKTVLGLYLNYFDKYDESIPALYSHRDEAQMFEFLETGLDEIMSIGEVHATERFKKMNIKKKFGLNVGVSIESNIMDLTITSDELEAEELMEIIKSYRQKKKFFRLRSGEFIGLEDNDIVEELSNMMEMLGVPLKKFVDGKMQLPAYRALYLDKMLERNSDIYADRDKHFKKLVKEFKTVEDSDYEIPKTVKKTLRSYQKLGFRWLRTLDSYGFGGILADEMGLGKTLQVISVLLSNKLENPKDKHTSLIVCPASLVFNWGEEIKKFAPELSCLLVVGTKNERDELIKDCMDHDVVVTSYDLLKRDIDKYDDKHFRFEVIDEAQYIKNKQTAAAKAVKVIDSTTRFALTGTPIENRLSELWSIFDYLMPGFLYDYQTFRESFETPVVKYGDEDVMKRLRRMASPFILRRKKSEVLKDLPDKLEEIRFAGFEKKQKKLYDAQVLKLQNLLKATSNEDFNKKKIQILAELTRIRQICCDPSLIFENYDGESAKREGLMELVEGAIDGGHKTLIFSQFTSMFELIEADLKERGIAYYKITGSTPKEKRVEMVNAFNKDDTPIFLISLKAGGTGLNLIGADVVIHYDPWWNVAVQNQATDRAHRIGQTKVVTVYKLIAKGTIEEKIVELQEKKKKLAEDILNSDAVASSEINREELLELLG